MTCSPRGDLKALAIPTRIWIAEGNQRLAETHLQEMFGEYALYLINRSEWDPTEFGTTITSRHRNLAAWGLTGS